MKTILIAAVFAQFVAWGLAYKLADDKAQALASPIAERMAAIDDAGR